MSGESDKSAAIGVFDSGLGGLTVLRTLVERFPHENFVYLGDLARIPYGTKSPETVRRYLKQNIDLMLKLGVKAVVIACNSASSVADGMECPVPIYDVIGPGARRAAQVTKNRRVGVIGTRTTVQSRAYVRALEAVDKDLDVQQQPCSLLVALVEEGLVEDPITNLITYRYLSPLIAAGIDTLILGCTHFPVLRAAIQKVIGPSVECVDSAEAICGDLTKDFASGRLVANESTRSVRYFATDFSEHSLQLARRIMSPHPAGPFDILDIG